MTFVGAIMVASMSAMAGVMTYGDPKDNRARRAVHVLLGVATTSAALYIVELLHGK